MYSLADLFSRYRQPGYSVMSPGGFQPAQSHYLVAPAMAPMPGFSGNPAMMQRFPQGRFGGPFANGGGMTLAHLMNFGRGNY